MEARNCFAFQVQWAGTLPWNSSWLLLLPYQIPRHSSRSLVVIHLSCITLAQAFSTFSMDWTESGQPGQGSSFSNFLPSWKCVNIGWLVHNSVIITHIFQVLLHFRGSFSRFTVKFNHSMLLHVKTSDTWNNHMLTLTATKWQLLMPQRWACGHCDKHILVVRTTYYFANLLARHSEKEPVSLFTGHTVYTGCNRRNGPDFGRVLLSSNYTDITQNTYIQIWTVTEILAREKSGLLWCLRTVLRFCDVILPSPWTAFLC